MRGSAEKETNHMTNEATTTDTAIEAPQETPTKAKKPANSKKPASKGTKKAKSQTKAAPQKTSKPRKAEKAGAKKAPKESAKTRSGNKTEQILALIGRAKGATLAEIMEATQWQAHSVRGFISTAAKKHSINIESSKNEAGDRVYKSGK